MHVLWSILNNNKSPIKDVSKKDYLFLKRTCVS